MSDLTLCEQCGKEPAAVFILRKNGDAEQKQALCLQCAEKRRIPAVKKYVKQRKKSGAAVGMCEQCREQPAVVFVSVSKDGREQEKQGLFAFCAREQGLRPVTETLADMDFSEEELRRIHAEILEQAQQPQGFLQKLRRIFKKS